MHHGRLRSLTVLAACRLIVQVLLLYLYHTKAISFGPVKPHALPQVPGLNLGSTFAFLECASTTFSRLLPFFNLQQVWKSRIKQPFPKSASSPPFSDVFTHMCGSDSVSNWLQIHPKWGGKGHCVGAKVSSVYQTFLCLSPPEYSTTDEGGLCYRL